MVVKKTGLYPGIELIELAKYVMTTGVKEFDALHIACAITGGCDYFITVDKRALKYQDKRIKVCNPIEFINDYGGDAEW